MSARHTLIAAGLGSLAALQADRWLAPFSRGRGIILTLHHVRPWQERAFAPNRSLEVTPDFLEDTLDTLHNEGFQVVPLDAVPGLLSGPEPERPFAVLTVDDGYQDVLDHAWPILRQRGVPWTLFVSPALAEGKPRLWWIDLEEAVRRLDHIEFALGGETLSLPAATLAQKEQAFRTATARLRAAGRTDQLAAVRELARLAGFDQTARARLLCAGWDTLRNLARDPLVTLGAHTLTHPVLSRRRDRAAWREIAFCRDALAERLGVRIDHLAYPHGDPSAVGPRDFAHAARAGYRTAVTTRPDHVRDRHAAALHRLPRVSLNGLHQSRGALRVLLSGAPFWLAGARDRP